MANEFYFDTLPLHPQPQPFESLTSYMTRLAENNGIRAVYGLSSLCFPDKSIRNTSNMADFPPLRLEHLSRLASCPVSTLLTTTFHHLGKKFGRSTHPQASSRFLTETLADHLRYCPRCVAEKGYYSLLWRFNSVICCPEHKCLLMDYCGMCGNTMPFLAQPLQIGVCPKCVCSFAQSKTQLASRDTRLSSAKQVEQLGFLLAPHPLEHSAHELMKRVGRKLDCLRVEAGISRRQMIEIINIPLTMLASIETGKDLQNGGSSFAAYIKVIDYFGLDFKELFREAIESRLVEKPLYVVHKQEELLTKVQAAIEFLRDSQKKISWRAVVRLTGVAWETLRKRPAIKLVVENAKKQEYEGLVRLVMSAIEDLERQGKRISLASVGREINAKRGLFGRHVELLHLIQEARANQILDS